MDEIRQPQPPEEKKNMSHIFSSYLRAIFVVCVCSLCLSTVGYGQSARERRNREEKPSARELEARAAQAEQAMIEEFKDIANAFYNSGEKEKAMQMLKRLKDLSPELQGVDDHIKSIDAELLQENQEDIDVDTRKGVWEQIGQVYEEKRFLVQAAGEFRVTYAATISVDGLEPDKDAKDYLPGAPLGCLLGVIVVDGKPGRPFPIRSKVEHTPKKDGLLFVKVNVPEGARCTGKLKVRVSGYINTAAR
ncbi:MAG: hypothetical protein Fues2KO_52640 [Fuerstiella sp.]